MPQECAIGAKRCTRGSLSLSIATASESDSQGSMSERRETHERCLLRRSKGPILMMAAAWRKNDRIMRATSAPLGFDQSSEGRWRLREVSDA